MPDRAPRHKADPELFASRQHAIVFGAALHQGIFCLHGRDRLNGMSLADCAGARLRESEMQHFAFLDEFLNRASNVLDRHVRIDTMLVEEVNAVGL